MAEIKRIPLKSLQNNTGFEIESGRVKANPRFIRDAQYDNLLRSLRESDLTEIEPLKVFKHGEKYIVIGGNMRLRALQELNVSDVDCIIIPQTYTADMLNKAIIIDNSTHGEWNMDMLANDWDTEQLKVWGLDMPVYECDITQDNEDEEEDLTGGREDGEEYLVPFEVELRVEEYNALCAALSKIDSNKTIALCKLVEKWQ